MSDKTEFFGGVPTAPDVRRIRDKWPDEKLRPGDRISYAEIETVTGEEYGASRFRTITNAWCRAILSESAVFMGVEAGSGFVVLGNDGIADRVSYEYGRINRAARKTIKTAGYVDRERLSDEKRRRVDHHVGAAAKIIATGQIKGKAKLPSITDGQKGK